MTLEQALALLRAASRDGEGAGRGDAGRSRSWAPIRRAARPIVVRDGRFGPYVTDGETNASLRRGDTPESVTVERAVELLAERRAKSA